MRTLINKGVYKIDDTYYRNRKKFLFFPKTIGKEKRWWEMAEWKEYWFTGGASCEFMQWDALEWLN